MVSELSSPCIPEQGKHLVYATELETRDEDGELVCENQFVTFVRNQGGYGGTNEVSNRAFLLVERLSSNQNQGTYLKTILSQKQLFNLLKRQIVLPISKRKNSFQKVKQHYTGRGS